MLSSEFETRNLPIPQSYPQQLLCSCFNFPQVSSSCFIIIKITLKFFCLLHFLSFQPMRVELTTLCTFSPLLTGEGLGVRSFHLLPGEGLGPSLSSTGEGLRVRSFSLSGRVCLGRGLSGSLFYQHHFLCLEITFSFHCIKIYSA